MGVTAEDVARWESEPDAMPIDLARCMLQDAWPCVWIPGAARYTKPPAGRLTIGILTYQRAMDVLWRDWNRRGAPLTKAGEADLTGL